MKEINILDFIKLLRKTDEYIPEIYNNGGCFKFALFIRSLFPGAILLINRDKNHVCVEYFGKKYDINGEVKSSDFDWLTLQPDDYEMAFKWSFRNKNLLKLTECPNCEEPITHDA